MEARSSIMDQTGAEALRVKAYLVVQRNVVRGSVPSSPVRVASDHRADSLTPPLCQMPSATPSRRDRLTAFIPRHSPNTARIHAIAPMAKVASPAPNRAPVDCE